jgi:hypothetical protein
MARQLSEEPHIAVAVVAVACLLSNLPQKPCHSEHSEEPPHFAFAFSLFLLSSPEGDLLLSLLSAFGIRGSLQTLLKKSVLLRARFSRAESTLLGIATLAAEVRFERQQHPLPAQISRLPRIPNPSFHAFSYRRYFSFAIFCPKIACQAPNSTNPLQTNHIRVAF